MKKKMILFIIFAVVSAIFIQVIGVIQIKRANAFELIYLSMTNSWSWDGASTIPVPFRQKIAKLEFYGRTYEELTAGNGISDIYDVLGFGNDDPRITAERRNVSYDLANNLISKGLSIDKADSNGCTPLQKAIINNDEISYRYLTKSGALRSFNTSAKLKICRLDIDNLYKIFMKKIDN